MPAQPATRPATAKPATPALMSGYAMMYNRVATPNVFGLVKNPPRFWVWSPQAFKASLADVAAGRRHIDLLVSHEVDDEPLAGTGDKSLIVSADRHGLRFRIDAGTRRGANVAEWLRQRPTFRSVSVGGVFTAYNFGLLGKGKSAMRLGTCTEFFLEEISLTDRPGFGNRFTASANPTPARTSAMTPQHESPVGRALRAVEAAERGQLQMVHVQPEAIQAAIAAGLLVAVPGRLKHRLTARGRATLAAGGSGGSPPKIGARGGVTTLHF